MAYVYPILIKSFITNLVNMVPEPFELVEDDGEGGGGATGAGAAGGGVGGGSWVGGASGVVWPSIKIIYIIII